MPDPKKGSGDFHPQAIEHAGLWMAGITLALLAGEHATAMNAIERGLALNPNCAFGWGVAGWAQPLMGRSDLAVESIERAMRLSSLDPLSYLFKTGLALAHGAADRHSEAMDWIDRSLRDQPAGYPR